MPTRKTRWAHEMKATSFVAALVPLSSQYGKDSYYQKSAIDRDDIPVFMRKLSTALDMDFEEFTRLLSLAYRKELSRRAVEAGAVRLPAYC